MRTDVQTLTSGLVALCLSSALAGGVKPAPGVSQKALRLHQEAIVIDAYSAAQFYYRPDFGTGTPGGKYDLPKALRGRSHLSECWSTWTTQCGWPGSITWRSVPISMGGGGLQSFEDASQFPQVTEALLRRGYGEEEIRKLLGENFLRVFRVVTE